MSLRTPPAPRARPPRAPTRLTRAALVVLGLVLVVALSSRLARNLVWAAPREVSPGFLVRCGQLDVDDLSNVLERFGIRRVVSLRKFDPPAPELRAEIEFLAARGLEHRNIALSPTRLPKPEALVELLEAFRSGPYPILVHCEEGVDRTGLATVIWLVVHARQPLEEARRSQLSWRNGHIALGQAHAMDDFLELYERTANGQDLATWIEGTYPSLYSGANRAPSTELAHGPTAP